ncbi:NAD-glutamate dehydrogenase [Sphingosinicella humi]|uniref:NAD-glutamate dehydrogenase n=1 Tax=Allosphingosinicella humi TaxID=2068657 RepID=A0A2U2J404_9SPHN|nr:NAD-glutamate dehydrogenase [Sphingosinicella humi]PWG03047.1 NAD-glutamate dehydrogenase [Sphingosinicella humi]
MNSVSPALAPFPSHIPDAVRTRFEYSLGRSLGAAEQLFLEQIGAGAAPNDLAGLSSDELADNFAELWRWTSEAAVPLPRVRVRANPADPLSGTLVEIADTERPFQMDSVVAELSEQGHVASAIFSAVVPGAWTPDAEAADPGEQLRIVQIVLPATTETRRTRLVEGLTETLADVRAAVEDFAPMRSLLADTIARLQASEAADHDQRAEEIAFLEWLGADHFVLLGTRTYRYPRTPQGTLAPDEPLYAPEDGLGILRDPARTILRRANEPSVLTPQLRRQAEKPESLVVAKSNFRSRIHRRVHCDYVGVTLHDTDGTPSGEVRFLGLFTAEAYDKASGDVPLIRLKTRRVIEQLTAAPGGPNPKRLRNILENYPRDELFQVEESELASSVLAVARLRDRPRVRLLARTDPFDRFVSALLFVPRERYDSTFSERAGEMLAAAWRGRVSAAYPSFADGPLARIHFIIGLTPGDHGEPALDELEAAIAAASLTWRDHFEAAIDASNGTLGEPDRLLARWVRAFGAGYREQYDAQEALADIAVIEAMVEDQPIAVRAYRREDDAPTVFRFKLYHRETAVPLADVIPILQDMCLKALDEDGYAVRPADGPTDYWIHEFLVDDPRGADLVFGDIARPFEEAFIAAWTGQTESDGFSRLVLELGTSWREAALVRALARFRQQTGLDPSQAVQEAALVDHPRIAALLLELFRTRFDPAVDLSADERNEAGERLRAEIEALLDEVPSLDTDRALRRILALILAVKRTNFYQQAADGAPKPHIALKIASEELADLSAPKPYREIFVSAPNVEGSHLRFGPVARGGLRWSDRRDDFRSEVLGLVKAQQVKNAVIVPVGSKGGFVAKHASRADGPEQMRAAGVDAYRTFLSGMLDVTDNIDADGAVVPPPNVIAHEGSDPYLVVAADKGTATFSDIANEVSASYGFWLGDAFASGGSAGYDHKAMGITARGAWEAVKRHFRERGKDIQAEPFTAVGVGDMSGDVFGNGMLLSKQTRLVAAFDHRDIFIDPDPDPAVSWAERKRLFELPRSSWQDYDKAKISAGGGVFPRSMKSIPLSPEMRAALGTDMESATPIELMRAILKAPAELLYMGGIGTYVKGSGETNADASDKANDAVRVNGADLRVAIVGEGANLGFTQAARIEYARTGGRINTDAIDNSGGVDSSDLEVNIKILTAALEAKGELDRESRDALLASMTDEVADLVLAHNRDQTLALSLIEADAVANLDTHAEFIAEFEKQGRLDRAVEGLPRAEALAERKANGEALTRPELAVLMAYSKLALFDAIVASPAPDDPWFEATLRDYFPKPLHRFEEAMKEHRLRREIVATVLANDIVNVTGPTFAWRLMAGLGCDAGTLATAFVAARAIFRISGDWAAVHALGSSASSETQMALFRSLAAALRRQTEMLARRSAEHAPAVGGLVEAYRAAADRLRDVANDLPQTVEGLSRLNDAITVIDLASECGREAPETAAFFNDLRAAIGSGRLQSAAAELEPADRFERVAIDRIAGELVRGEETLARTLLRTRAGDADLSSTLGRWLAEHRTLVEETRNALAEIEASDGPWSLGKLIIAHRALEELVRTSGA